MSHSDEHCDELLGAYVLRACSEAEAVDVAEHLRHCARCETAAQRLRSAADRLLERAAPTPPPPRIKDGLMAAVRAEAALFEAARAGAYDSGASKHGRRGPPPRGRRRRPALAGAAAVLVVLAVAAGPSGGLGAGTPDRAVISAQVHAGQPRGASAGLEVRGTRADLRVRGLADPGRERIYQVWVRRDRQVPQPAGAVLRVDARGVARVRVPGDIRSVDQVLVTSEPVGGSALPTSVPVLEVETSA